VKPAVDAPPTITRLRFLTRWGRLQLGLIEIKAASTSDKVFRERPIVDHVVSAAFPCFAHLQLADDGGGAADEAVLQTVGSFVRFLEKPGICETLKATNALSAEQFRQPLGALDDATEKTLRLWHTRVLPTLAGLFRVKGGPTPGSPCHDLARWSRTFLAQYPKPRAPVRFRNMRSMRLALSRGTPGAAESFVSCASDASEHEVPPEGAEHELEHASDSDNEGFVFQSSLSAPSLGSFAQASGFFSLIGMGPGPSTWEFAKGAEEHGWDEADATPISVRGPAYIQDRVKTPSAASLCETVLVDLVHVGDKGGYPNMAAQQGGLVSELRRAGETRFLFVVNFCMAPLHLAVAFAFRDAPASGALPVNDGDPAKALLRRFVEDMDDAERNQHFKVIPWVREGPWLVQKAVGRTPAIIGKSLKINYFSKPGDYFEVSVDIFSSSAAQRILGLLKGAAKGLSMEVFFVLEGKSAEELPEQILGGFRVSHGDLLRTRGPI